MKPSYVRYLALLLWAIFLVSGAAPQTKKKSQDRYKNGIYVDSVKTYDEGAIENLLGKAVSSLSSLNAFDAGVTKQLGQIQGSTVNQTGLNLTGGKGTPPGQTAPSTYTLPSSLQSSAGDFLNEELQLGLQIVNLQLLLQGSLNDKSAQGDPEKRRLRTTLGFPIYITVPPGFQYQGAVAEVQVSVCAPRDSGGAGPFLSMLLPQEKTYNVASLVSKNTSIGASATIANVVNLGGSLLHGQQSYYLVKDQDTLAVQRPPDGACDNGQPPITFAWQFRPVLGQKVVRDGLRQSFAQISFSTPITGYAVCDLHVAIKTGWRRYDARTGRVGGRIDEPRVDQLPSPIFDLPPIPHFVQIQDNGGGNLTVVVSGAFNTPTRVRIGGVVQDSTSPNFEQ